MFAPFFLAVALSAAGSSSPAAPEPHIVAVVPMPGAAASTTLRVVFSDGHYSTVTVTKAGPELVWQATEPNGERHEVRTDCSDYPSEAACRQAHAAAVVAYRSAFGLLE